MHPYIVLRWGSIDERRNHSSKLYLGEMRLRSELLLDVAIKSMRILSIPDHRQYWVEVLSIFRMMLVIVLPLSS